MKPGRELDALIAEMVMGFEPWPVQDPMWECKAFKARYVPYGQAAKPCEPPAYSTDIAAAWKVVEKVLFPSRMFDFEIWNTNGVRDWGASFNVGCGVVKAAGESAPHAICLAALKAVCA